jgi:hypothetical protein
MEPDVDQIWIHLDRYEVFHAAEVRESFELGKVDPGIKVDRGFCGNDWQDAGEDYQNQETGANYSVTTAQDRVFFRHEAPWALEGANAFRRIRVV